MDWAILIAALVAAAGSVVGLWLQRQTTFRTQRADHEHADDARLYGRRMDLYTRLLKVLRGHERDLQRRSIEDDQDPEQVRAWLSTFFSDLASDSTSRLMEAQTILGEVRLSATADVVAAAQVAVSRLEQLQRGWMSLLLELLKDQDEQDLQGVFNGAIAPRQNELDASIEELEKAIRSEIRVGQ